MMLSRLALMPTLFLLSIMVVAGPESRIISHIATVGGDFQTTVHIENTSAVGQDYRLIPYAGDGSVLAEVTGTVGAGATQSLAVTSLFADTVSHFVIADTADAVRFSVSYTASEGVSTPGRARETQESASSWRLLAGDWTHGFDGVAAVNTGEVPTDLWLYQRDADGTIVAAEKVAENLAPMAKVTHVIGSPVDTHFSLADGISFDLTGTQPLAITALAGSQGTPLVLWRNEAVALNHATSRRDEVGVWTIEDGSLDDVFELMGHNVATDRLWQAELYRRSARATLAEIFGPDFAQVDSLFRVTGYSEAHLQAAFDNLDEVSRVTIQAYVDGFNRRIAETRQDPSLVPFEFLAVGLFEPAPWTVTDVLIWGSTLQRNFSGGFDGIHQIRYLSELQYLAGKYGPEVGGAMFNDIHWINDPSAQTMIPGEVSTKQAASLPVPVLRDNLPDFAPVATAMEQRRERTRELLKEVGAFIKGGSYAWAVAGSKTQSGNAMLYAGPQLDGYDFSAPARVLEGAIRGGGLDVSGMTIAGIPGIIVGRTPHHAWSMQVGHSVTSDLYLEQAPGELQRMETIKVRGAEDVEIPVFRTEHGFVINLDPLLALKYSHWGYEFGFVTALNQMASAQDVASFGDALEGLGVSMHITYADKDQNIAYWMTGREPIKPEGDWRVPQGTVAPPLEYDLDVIRPMPHDTNPAQGFYGGWNNKASVDYDDTGTGFRYGMFHRAHVVTDYLAAHDNLTVDDLNTLALNIGATNSSFANAGNPWSFVRDAFTQVVEANPTAERTEALALLSTWDGHFVDGGPAAWLAETTMSEAWLLADTWLANVLSYTFNDELDAADIFFTNRFESRFNILLHAMFPEISVTNNHDWLSNATDDAAPQTLDAVVLAALDQTLAELGPRPWVVDRPMAHFNHDLFGSLPGTEIPGLDRASYAQCIEMGTDGPVYIGSMFPLGQSGEVLMDQNGAPFFNDYYFRMMPYFATFQLRDFPLFGTAAKAEGR